MGLISERNKKIFQQISIKAKIAFRSSVKHTLEIRNKSIVVKTKTLHFRTKSFFYLAQNDLLYPLYQTWQKSTLYF